MVINGKIIPIGDTILVDSMYFGEITTRSGLIILDDDGKDRGIHPRWARVYAVGPKSKLPLVENDWVLINHGRWSRFVELEDGSKIRKVDPKDILMMSKEEPNAKTQYFKGKD